MPEREHPRDADRLIYAGLLGLTAAGILQMVEKDDLDGPLLVTVYCFAAALPLLAVGIITDYARRAGTPVPPWRDFVGVVGILIAVVGLGAMLWHFQIGVVVVFFIFAVIGFILVRML